VISFDYNSLFRRAIIYSLSSAFGDKLSGLSVPIFCSSTLRDYFGLIFDELFTVFDSRGEFSRLNVFFISTVKKLLQEVSCQHDGRILVAFALLVTSPSGDFSGKIAFISGFL
jgi:hypothetical protein